MARRAHGEGSLYAVAGGWRGYLYDGGGRRRYVRAATQAEARARLDELRAELAQRLRLDRRLTVGAWLEAWLEDLRGSTRRPRTYEAHESSVRLYLRPLVGAIRLAELEPADVRTLHRKLRARGLAPATIGRIHAALRQALQVAVVDGKLARNAAALVSPPPVPRFQARPLSAGEAMAALEAMAGHRYAPFWTFLVATGCRFGEAAGLRWSAVDLERATVSLDQAAARVPRAFRGDGPGWELGELKTQGSRRVLPLPPFGVLAVLRAGELAGELRAAAAVWGAGLAVPGCPACDRRLRTPCSAHELVFPSRRGTPLRDDHVGAAWRALLEQAGLPRARLHDLRHTLGTLARRSGTDLRTVQELLGHSSITVTSGIYVGAVPEALRAAADRLEALLGGPIAARTAASGPERDG